MTGPSMRIALLAMAAWAVLFAPGAAAADSGAGIGLTHHERVGVAMIAPTFGTDSVIATRSCRDELTSTAMICRDLSHAIAGDSVAAPQQRVVRVGDAQSPTSLDAGDRSSAPTRAPPMG